VVLSGPQRQVQAVQELCGVLYVCPADAPPEEGPLSFALVSSSVTFFSFFVSYYPFCHPNFGFTTNLRSCRVGDLSKRGFFLPTIYTPFTPFMVALVDFYPPRTLMLGVTVCRS
jgi:hypothetical protein